MEFESKSLGSSNITVTRIGLGLWSAGGDSWGKTEDQHTLDLIDFALDAGVNYYDTADVYNNGRSEELLGQAMKGRRDKFVVATKIGWLNYDGEAGRAYYDTAEKIVEGVETNLKRLNSDYVDVIQSHIDYRDVTMEAFIEGFMRLQKDGKVRDFGLSTSNFEYIKAFNEYSGGACATLQIDYSILNRTPEAEIFPYCLENDIGVIVRGPLAMGILTGKFSSESKFEASDWRNRWFDNPDEHNVFLEDLIKVEQLKPLTNENRSLAQLAIQFVLQYPAVTTIIPGAKTKKQFKETAAVGAFPIFNAEETAAIEAITPAGGGRKIWPA